MAERNASDNDIPIWVLDTVTKPKPEHAGSVILAGSHGGVYAGYLAASAGPRGIILNDAGVGRDKAGIASLDYLQDLGIAAATVAHSTGCIGDGEDMLSRGVISYTNAAAGAVGCAVGEPAVDCARKMRAAPTFEGSAPAHSEGRYKFRAELWEAEIWGLDSASLLIPEDAGRVVIIASHGAILAANRASRQAIYQPVRAAVFHDAGVGRNRAGISRLPVMDEQGVAGATVGHESARIGDARSIWNTGMISHVNELAAAWGARAGMSCQDFAIGALRRRLGKGLI